LLDVLGKLLPRLTLIAVVVSLVLPADADAHRLTTVAVDYRVRVLSSGDPGVRASTRDGGRKLELSVRPDETLVVLGYVKEPFLRFSPAGVEAAGASPTASAARLLPADGRHGWTRLTTSHAYAWTDQRLLPPPGPDDNRVRWSIPARARGERIAIVGESWREGRPALWPWLLAGVVVFAAAVALLRKRSSWSRRATLGLAVVAGAASTASVTGLALTDTGSSTGRWFQVAGVAAIVIAGTAVALRVGKAFDVAIGAVAVVAALECLSQLGMLRHAVVLSALPAVVARGLVTVGLAAGVAAVVFTFFQPQPNEKGR
jgi:hypothetical protein